MEPVEQWIAAVSNSFNNVVHTTIQSLPNILAAIVLFLFGWLLARLFRMLILKGAKGFDRLYQTTWLKDKPDVFDRRYTFSRLVSELVFWFLILFFLSIAIETLGFSTISKWMRGFYAYVPNIFASFLIIFFGYILSSAVRMSIARLGMKDAVLLSKIVGITILTLAILLGLAQLGINIRLLTNLLTITIGAFLGGGAFAFGLGAASAVGNIIAAHYLRRNYEVGQMVKINTVEGKIMELTPTTVVLSTAEGRVTIPAKQFNEQIVISKD